LTRKFALIEYCGSAYLRIAAFLRLSLKSATLISLRRQVNRQLLSIEKALEL